MPEEYGAVFIQIVDRLLVPEQDITDRRDQDKCFVNVFAYFPEQQAGAFEEVETIPFVFSWGHA
jgi:hypothetical protein